MNPQVESWCEVTRHYLKSSLHMGIGEFYVTADDIREAIFNGIIPVPPKMSDRSTRAQAIRKVFDVPYYRTTGEQVKSTDKTNRGRSICIWEYLPEFDDRSALKGGVEWFVMNVSTDLDFT